MDCVFKTPEGNFNYRVAGVVSHQNRLLVMTEKNIPHWYLPGGRVKLHESAEAALKREFAEELYLPAEIKRPLWLVESFFMLEGKNEKFHELCLCYLVDLPYENLPAADTWEQADSDGASHIFRWLTPEEVRGARLYPVCLKECFPALPEHLELVTVFE